MTVRPQNAELARQLRSLSIVKDGGPGQPAPMRPTPTATGRQGSRWPVVLICMAVVVAGAGVWATRPDAPALLADMAAALGLGQPTPNAVNTPAAAATTVAPAIPAVASALPTARGVIGTGYVVAERETVLGSDLGGRVAAVMVGVGDAFTKGMVLARLDDSAATRDVAIAKLGVTTAETALARLKVQREKAVADADRLARLVARGAAPEADAEAAGFALRLVDADLQAAGQAVQARQLELDRARADLARHAIAAPFDGVVVEQLAIPGDLVASAMNGGDPDAGLLVLLDTASLIVTADLAETNLSQVRAGQTADIVLDAWPDRRFAAHVQGIVPRASIQKGTVNVRLTFDAPDAAILANMAAKVTFAADISQ